MRKIVFERFVFIVLLIMLWFLAVKSIRTTDMYHSSFTDVVEKVIYNTRDSTYINIQFKNTGETNMLSGIQNPQFSKNKDLIVKGDAIFKPIFSKDFFVFRKRNGSYLYLYKITSID
ncbi:hypothetical protein [Paenimyroides aestuarii]|uniref:Uncharacterized protein n=1 Tax=Paenimyroides aestuarii TaxID=2968490 RepID=A0ABY5NVV7_9FLAO|nr:hypothetical protein [Paenimyroides aestuarii]UUV22721.1 hypothetical protein NPX36_06685 [Paenimyroides aestuarii]